MSTDPRDQIIAERDRMIAERDRIIAERDQRIAELEQLLRLALARIAESDRRIIKLEAELAELKAQLKRNSTNSSKPPSSDPPGVVRPSKKSKGKKRGGQPGHQGHHRKLLPSDKVSRTVDVIPPTCDCCGERLHGSDAEPYRHQVVDLPFIVPDVTEFRLHVLGCSHCGRTTRAKLPSDVPHGSFGPRLSAFVAICTSKYHISKRGVREFLADVLGVDLSLGSVSKIEQQVSIALASPVSEAREYVRQRAVVNADETSWRENKRKAWLWVAATRLVTVFVVATSRCAAVAKHLLGETFKGVLVTDRWAGYSWVGVSRRQICWAHLKRDFQSWVDGGGTGAKIGRSMLAEVRRLFRLWYRVRDGTLDRASFVKKMRPIQINVGTLLSEASWCPTGRVRGMAKEMLKLEWAFWTFVETVGVEPTNNFGERQIRHAVLWRKGCFGTDSASGSLFVERTLTVITTLRQQQRNALEFIAATCRAELTGSEKPSLIVDQDHIMLAAA